ncbi:erythromycin esterase family protein [Actinomadura hibisca]|uniref:erythromycin esterase family protein n=1 Tax=Actinomadura hibisca TaxID=68565 RepID=UPI00082965B2|nr:erythromycin esterase family protein [Actinomadura hibisca]
MSDIEDVRRTALPLTGEEDLDPLLERIGGARCVLLGEASHGTHEYYAWRAAITRRLISEHGFSFVAVEGDWPDCWRVGRSVALASGAPGDPRQALDAYHRWPTWMWANDETTEFCRWLRRHNEDLPERERVGFYGLDVYSLWESLRAVILHLSEHRPEYLETALAAYRCFEPHGEDPQAYAREIALAPDGCRQEVLDLLTDLRRAPPPDKASGPVEELNARQNAEVAAGAERYYRAMIDGGPESWNVRDGHMADTLDRLLDFHGGKAVVWAHNTHVGDARATDMVRAGMTSLGRLARERYGTGNVALVGFAGGSGTVIAAPRWGATMDVMTVPPPRAGSLEALLTDAAPDRALFVPPSGRDCPSWLTRTLGHRAIGVVYDPGRDHHQFVPTRVAERYDALCWIRDTSALRPLHLEAARRGELETLPTGV